MVMGRDDAGNLERLCWRRPVAVYWAGLDWKAVSLESAVGECGSWS
jgi:hypothetical protein